MKIILKSSILFLSILFAVQISSAQKSKPVSTTIHVEGLCGQCKARIEKAVDIKGVKFAEYDKSKHELEITYRPNKISEMQIHKAIAAVGHDTDKVKASDEVYNALNACCQYRDHDHDDFEHHDEDDH